MGYVRTGRGFIDVTEKGLEMLGVSDTSSLVFIRASPAKKGRVYEELKGLLVRRTEIVKGDMDILSFVSPEKLDGTLKAIKAIEGVEETKVYVTSGAQKEED